MLDVMDKLKIKDSISYIHELNEWVWKLDMYINDVSVKENRWLRSLSF